MTRSTSEAAVLEPSKPQDWLALSQQYILPLNDFLSFATLTASAIEEILVHPTSEPDDIMVPLVFRTIDMQRTTTESSLNIFDMLFTLPDATDSVNLLEAWFDLNTKYGPAVRQLLASQYAPFEWAENSFLAASRAAEAFYARKFKEQPYTQEQIDSLIGIIGEHVTDGDLQDFATRVIKRSNYFPQQDQYKKLLEHSGKAGGDILAIEPEFAKIVTDIRNRITHPSSRNNRGVVRRHHLEQALRWVVRACLLKELDFDDKQVGTLLERNKRYDREIHSLGPQQA
jgi:ApeA N-terminal domain 1